MVSGGTWSHVSTGLVPRNSVPEASTAAAGAKPGKYDDASSGTTSALEARAQKKLRPASDGSVTDTVSSRRSSEIISGVSTSHAIPSITYLARGSLKLPDATFTFRSPAVYACPHGIEYVRACASSAFRDQLVTGSGSGCWSRQVTVIVPASGSYAKRACSMSKALPGASAGSVHGHLVGVRDAWEREQGEKQHQRGAREGHGAAR